MQVKKLQLVLDMEQWTDSKSGKQYVKAVYFTLLISLICRVHHVKCQCEAQAGIKIAGRNINNLRYANNTTLMAESEEELKSLLMKAKEEWKSWIKVQHSQS